MSVADFSLPPETVCPSGAPAPRRRRLLLRAAGVAAAGLALLLALPRPHPVTSSGSGMTEAQTREEARRALTGFLRASTPEQRAALVMDGDRMLPLMQAYYAGREVDPLSAGDFQPASWSFNTESADRVALELPRPRGLSTVVACLKKTGSGEWLMDWEIWAQSMDGRFRDFLNHPVEGAQTLRVRLDLVSACPEEVKLEVSDPFNAGSSLNLEVPRADLVALYSADLSPGATRTATVQLVWVNDSLTGTLSPILRRHVCWGFQSLDGVEAAEREPARARRHHPPLPATDKMDTAVGAGLLSSSMGISPSLKVPASPSPETVKNEGKVPATEK